MELTAAEQECRERIIGHILAARTLAEITEARQMLQDWISTHPGDLGIADGFDHLAMSRTIAESREGVQTQAA